MYLFIVICHTKNDVYLKIRNQKLFNACPQSTSHFDMVDIFEYDMGAYEIDKTSCHFTHSISILPSYVLNYKK
ncbi:hypothetical protein MAR_030199 [Mya arenaria]|uniref:Uncharacterized protein n=1 Tax=Mya arenaria TaxID=6604 RepID=A0ABY7DJI8_MYAAR|nr:hypothetical protein MAR_030199 [Mya arenaria]